jgi:hypothetical protein
MLSLDFLMPLLSLVFSVVASLDWKEAMVLSLIISEIV